MDARNDENLEELLAEFYDAAQAKQMAQEIQKDEQILHANPAPEPANSLLADIKERAALRPAGQRTAARRLVLAKAAAVAAVFIILAWAGAKLLDLGRTQQQAPGPVLAMISSEIWESDDITADDPDLATLSAGVDEILRNLLTVRLDELANGNGQAVGDIEAELIEIESNFWKG